MLRVEVFLFGTQTGLMDDGVKITLLGVWMTLFVVFAGRKFFQPIKVNSSYGVIACRSRIVLEDSKAAIST